MFKKLLSAAQARIAAFTKNPAEETVTPVKAAPKLAQTGLSFFLTICMALAFKSQFPAYIGRNPIRASTRQQARAKRTRKERINTYSKGLRHRASMGPSSRMVRG